MKPYENKDLVVTYKDKAMMLNPRLLEQQGIEDMESINKLKDTHVERFKIFEAMENTDDSKELQELAIQFEKLEFKQQKLWGFEPNSDFHRWWEVPKCTCPKSDNRDAYGTPYRYYVGKCPVHTSLKKD